MGRFALFSWQDYEASGGAGDFVRFGDLDELLAEAERIVLSTPHESAQIADAETMRRVCWAERHFERHPLTGHAPIVSVKWHDYI